MKMIASTAHLCNFFHSHQVHIHQNTNTHTILLGLSIFAHNHQHPFHIHPYLKYESPNLLNAITYKIKSVETIASTAHLCNFFHSHQVHIHQNTNIHTILPGLSIFAHNHQHHFHIHQYLKYESPNLLNAITYNIKSVETIASTAHLCNFFHFHQVHIHQNMNTHTILPGLSIFAHNHQHQLNIHPYLKYESPNLLNAFTYNVKSVEMIASTTHLCNFFHFHQVHIHQNMNTHTILPGLSIFAHNHQHQFHIHPYLKYESPNLLNAITYNVKSVEMIASTTHLCNFFHFHQVHIHQNMNTHTILPGLSIFAHNHQHQFHIHPYLKYESPNLLNAITYSVKSVEMIASIAHQCNFFHSHQVHIHHNMNTHRILLGLSIIAHNHQYQLHIH